MVAGTSTGSSRQQLVQVIHRFGRPVGQAQNEIVLQNSRLVGRAARFHVHDLHGAFLSEVVLASQRPSAAGRCGRAGRDSRGPRGHAASAAAECAWRC